mgnify:CR=1 FL=1
MTSVPKEIYEDHRYVNIGDLPTGFGPYQESGIDTIFVRPFTVRELNLLYVGANTEGNGLEHILRAVNMCLSCDVNILTDGDLEYVMAWLRQYSFPKTPSLVTWYCRKVNFVYSTNKAFYEHDQPDENTIVNLGLEREQCNKENNEIVHNAKMMVDTLDDDDLTMAYSDLDFPRVGTLTDYHTLLYEYPEDWYEAKVARWVREGNTLDEKIQALRKNNDPNQYKRILECMKRYHHGIHEKMKLRCRGCGNTMDRTLSPNITTFFASNSEQSILDMQYTLLSEFGLQPDDDMPSKTLLYHHSCLMRDKKDEEEKRKLQEAVRKT